MAGKLFLPSSVGGSLIDGCHSLLELASMTAPSSTDWVHFAPGPLLAAGSGYDGAQATGRLVTIFDIVKTKK